MKKRIQTLAKGIKKEHKNLNNLIKKLFHFKSWAAFILTNAQFLQASATINKVIVNQQIAGIFILVIKNRAGLILFI